MTACNWKIVVHRAANFSTEIISRTGVVRRKRSRLVTNRAPNEHYFHSRERYAVVEKDKPAMVKDLYIIPVEAGEALPVHVEMLELLELYCELLLARFGLLELKYVSFSSPFYVL